MINYFTNSRERLRDGSIVVSSSDSTDTVSHQPLSQRLAIKLNNAQLISCFLINQ